MRGGLIDWRKRDSLSKRPRDGRLTSGRLLKVVGPEGGDVVKVHQDASVYVARLESGVEANHKIAEGRGAYFYLIEGRVSLNKEDVSTGDAAKVTEEPSLHLLAEEPSELILVDVPMQFEPVGVWRGT